MTVKRRKKRIAIIVHSLYGGGMERVAAQLSEMFSDAGYEVYIFLGVFQQRKNYLYKGNVILIPYTLLQDFNIWFKDIFMLMYETYQVKKFKKEYQIDVTISFGPMKNLINILSGGRGKKILTIHSCISVRNDLKGLYVNRAVFHGYNFADQVVAVSRWCKEDLVRNYGIRRERVKVIYNPVEKSEAWVSPLEKENVVLIVGRLQDVKRQWHIVRAFRRVLDQVPDAKLVVAGKGENEGYLRQLCREMAMEDSVQFKGFVTAMEELYCQAKCVAFSSESEAFPCSVIEAISYGVPIVAADCPGGIREIIDRENCCPDKINKAVLVKGGFLTPTPDGRKYSADEPLINAEREMAESIVYLLKEKEGQIKISRNCMQISRLFDSKKILYRWERILL